MNRVVVITGASSGLGLSLAQKFVESGDSVYGLSRTRKSWKVAKRAVPDSKRFFLSQVDVTSERAVKQFLRGVYQQTKKLDVLVNNAGYSNRPTRVEDLTLKEFEKTLFANLISAFLMCKYALPIFENQKRGLIINISSMAGKRAVPGLAAYSASKFGMVDFSQCVAKESKSSRINCIAVCPGGMNTKLRARLFGREDAEKQQPTVAVADLILDVINGKIKVGSGGDIVIRHGAITAINPSPDT